MNKKSAATPVPIGAAAAALGVHPRTLRLYETAGLVKPGRRAGRRYYDAADMAWLSCLRAIVHEHKISLPALGRLLKYEGCWELKGCAVGVRRRCPARRGPGECWDKARACCRRARELCGACPIRAPREGVKHA